MNGARTTCTAFATWPDVDAPLRRWTAEMEIVARRVDRPWGGVRRALAAVGAEVPLGPAGQLQLNGPFVPIGDGTLAAGGRLYGRGTRLARYARVIVEVTTWGDGAGELRVVPGSRHVGRWGARRQRRYFALAHAAADHLLGAVNAGPPALGQEGVTPASLEAARWASAARVSVGL